MTYELSVLFGNEGSIFSLTDTVYHLYTNSASNINSKYNNIKLHRHHNILVFYYGKSIIDNCYSQVFDDFFMHNL